ncbi:unnamed protein product [Musa hybrid cultivar]
MPPRSPTTSVGTLFTGEPRGHRVRRPRAGPGVVDLPRRFIVVCVTFPSICHLQILRLLEFAAAVQSPSATAAGCSWMVMVTASQFAAVLVTTRHRSYDSLFNAGELACDSDEELECMKIVHPHGHTIFFQKRQAFGTYLENNRAGITILGFTVDRAWLHTIFIYAGNYFVPMAFGQDN